MARETKQSKQRRYQEIAGAVAVLIDSEEFISDDLHVALQKFVDGHLTSLIDILDPSVIRELLPTFLGIAERQAAERGLSLQEWARRANGEQFQNVEGFLEWQQEFNEREN